MDGETTTANERKDGSAFRIIGLCLLCILNFGSYYCFDNPAALEDNITTDMHISASKYGLLYSFYSWPNVILPLIGGYAVDRVIGIRLGSILFAGAIMIGQFVFAGGALLNSFILMLVGRIVFSLGGENLAVCQNSYTVRWFKGREMSTAFGIELSFARLGATVNLYAMKPLYGAVEKLMPAAAGFTVLGISLMLGGLSTLVSMASAFMLAKMDRWRESRNRPAIHDAAVPSGSQGSDTDTVATPTTTQESTSLIQEHDQDDSNGDTVRLSDIKDFPLSFWLLCAVCVCYYAAIFPFIGFGLVFFESKYSLSPYPWSEVVNSLVYFTSMVACAPLGALVDWSGRNAQWMLLAVALTALAHGALAFTFVFPAVPMAVMGVGYSLLAASLWPCVAFVVPDRALATAYGVMQSIQNLGLAILFITAGAVLDYAGYFALELYFLLFLTACFAALMLLIAVDAAGDGLCSMGQKQRANALFTDKST